jgi:hypothetical protein
MRIWWIYRLYLNVTTPTFRRFYGSLFSCECSISFYNLPKDGKIDYDFMNHIDRAIEKMVIKDVVEWSSNRLDATKKIVKKGENNG